MAMYPPLVHTVQYQRHRHLIAVYMEYHPSYELLQEPKQANINVNKMEHYKCPHISDILLIVLNLIHSISVFCQSYDIPSTI